MTKVKITGLPKMDLGGTHYSDRIPGINKKQMSYFGSKLSNVPADNILDDTKISTNIHELPEDLHAQANAEIEGGEKVVLPDGRFYTAKGKKHSKGGMQVNIPDGAYIVSDSKDTASNEDEQLALGLKSPSSNKPTANTPSKVFSLNVRKDHNKMISVLNDPKSDSIAKTTAMLSVKDNLDNIEKIKLLNDLKRNKQPLPQDNTLEEKQLKTELVQNKQFRLGGVQKYGTGTSNFMDPNAYDESSGTSRVEPNTPASKQALIKYYQHAKSKGYNGIDPTQNFDSVDWSKPQPNLIDPLHEWSFNNEPKAVVDYYTDLIKTGTAPNALKEKAKKYNGDFSKLTDQDKLDAYKEDPYFTWRFAGDTAKRQNDQMDLATNSTGVPKYLPIADPQLAPNSKFSLSTIPLNPKDNYQHIQRDWRNEAYDSAISVNQLNGLRTFHYNPALDNTVDLRGQEIDTNPMVNNYLKEQNSANRLIGNFTGPQQANVAAVNSMTNDKINQVVFQGQEANVQNATQTNNTNIGNHAIVSHNNNYSLAINDALNKDADTNSINERTKIGNEWLGKKQYRLAEYNNADWKNRMIEQPMAAVNPTINTIEYPHNPNGSFNQNYPGSWNSYQTKLMQASQDRKGMTHTEAFTEAEKRFPNNPEEQIKWVKILLDQKK